MSEDWAMFSVFCREYGLDPTSRVAATRWRRESEEWLASRAWVEVQPGD